MAAIEENQRPLCKAGAIGILSAIEAEVENGMAACKYLETIYLQLCHTEPRSRTKCSAKYIKQSVGQH